MDDKHETLSISADSESQYNMEQAYLVADWSTTFAAVHCVD